VLHSEDYPANVNLSPEQRFYARLFARQGAAALRSGKRRRQLLSLTLTPVDVTANRFDPELTRQTLDKAFVANSDIVFTTMADHPLENPRNGVHAIETSVLVSVARVDERGDVIIGGNRDLCRCAADFSKGPLHRGQNSTPVNLEPNVYAAPRAGALSFSRVGRWLDVRIGTHQDNGAVSTIIWRFEATLFNQQDCPISFSAIADSDLDLPDSPGKTLEAGNVQVGTPVMSISRTVPAVAAVLSSSGVPEMRWPANVLPAHRVGVFKVLNQMLSTQDSIALGTDEDGIEEAVGKPADWAIRPYIGFIDQSVATDDGNIEVTATALTSLPDFTVTAALKADILHAVGPNGSLKLYAQQTGEIVNIDAMPGNPNLIQIVFSDGSRQIVPHTAVLYVIDDNGKSVKLQAGMRLTTNQAIGDYVSRSNWRWPSLEATIGDNLYWLIEQFFSSVSIHPGDEVDSGETWSGPAVLYPAKYVTSVAHFAEKRLTGQQLSPALYWDLRDVRHYSDVGLENGVGCIFLPPIAYQDWENRHLLVGGIAFNLENPFENKRSHGSRTGRHAGKESSRPTNGLNLPMPTANG
jgi:hypothetical protein